MLFRLVKSEYDRYSERAYVEFRTADGDGGEIVAVINFHIPHDLQAYQTRDQAGDCP
jgi:hypothetical protein